MLFIAGTRTRTAPINAASSQAGTGQRQGWRPRKVTSMKGYVFIAPFLLLFIGFSAFPDVYTLILSFQHYAGYGSATAAGLQNYNALLHYPVFWTELENTLEYWVLHAVILIPVAFVLALVVRSRSVRGKSTWRAIIFLPQVMSIVAVTLAFQVMFASPYGAINHLLGLHVGWLTDFAITKWVVVALLVWQGLGFWFVVFLSGLTSIDPAVEEAAMIDGAGVVRRATSIVAPLMKNVFLFAVVIDAITSMALYTQPTVLAATQGVLDPSVAPLSSLVVVNLQSSSFGESAAAGWLLFLLTIIVSVAVFGSFRLFGRSGAARWTSGVGGRRAAVSR
ncbi:MAG TPA: sugar ABC transporter permease [Streptosporangiaceae bacterium]|nr:sugar ABC transporter permease [Streptosporangiaceae bacterium]